MRPSTLPLQRSRGGTCLLWTALLFFAAFALAHLLGLRTHLSAISLTAAEGSSLQVSAALALLYLLTWFGATLAAPILAIAGVLLWAQQRLTRGGRSTAAPTSDAPTAGCRPFHGR